MKRDFESILLIGSGPIVIGQACEFDYSGTQACRVLRELGYRVVLVNSNPATIMTDPDVADKTYIEPITASVVETILEKEKVDAVLPTLGGQTALNVAVELARSGALERLGVRMIGADLDAIEKAEDRDLFREAMREADLPVPRSGFASSVDQAKRLADEIGFPVILRPSFTLGGAGGGRAQDMEALQVLAEQAIRLSPVSSVLLEEDLTGWKEFELEVMRDRNDNAVIVCGIENLDPMGVHTGDSITVAPIQTLTDREYQRLRDMALEVLRAVGVDTGGSNVQFAMNPADGRIVIIEMNPRVSRSSALASKATGFPIAKIAARLAVGETLDQIQNDITGTTPACFEPSIDYVVVKIPRWAFEKFPSSDSTLGTRMKSVGEVMAIGGSFNEAFLKAVASLEVDRLMEYTLGKAGSPNDIDRPTWDRIFGVLQAMRQGDTPEEVSQKTGIDLWWLHHFADIIKTEQELQKHLPAFLETLQAEGARTLLTRAKKHGITDAHIAAVTDRCEDDVRTLRKRLGILPVFKSVDTCAAEFPSETPYFYSTYAEESEGDPLENNSVVVVGSGPNRIGQGIEFDYCCVTAAQEFRRRGRPVIMINSNPETVSTDYDTSNRLYFEPLTAEHVLNVLDREQPSGVVLQFGGQTPLKLAPAVAASGVPILGTDPESIELAENREKFRNLLVGIDLNQPRSLVAVSPREARELAGTLGYPVLVRPSHVLGGRGMRVCRESSDLELLFAEGVPVNEASPLLIDGFLEDAIELDVDAVADGSRVVVGAVLEHLEEAGVHSGDSTCVTPPYSVGEHTEERIRKTTEELARSLGVVGLLNIQFAVKGDTIYILEANPRASRTVPFVSKATGLPLVSLAVGAMLGETLQGEATQPPDDLICVKKPVLPFDRFPGEDTVLSPEMKSTGEVMGVGGGFGEAFAKAELAAGSSLPESGSVFLSVRDADKRALVFMAKQLQDMGFSLWATSGTAQFLGHNGLAVQTVHKLHEGSPNAVDLIREGKVQLVLNSPSGRRSTEDGRSIRAEATERGVLCVTTLPGMIATVLGIEWNSRGDKTVRSLQDWVTPVETEEVGVS